VKNGEPLLGTVKNGICGLSEIGSDVAIRLQHIPVVNANTILEEFIVMPNHFHAIIIIDRHAGDYISNQFQRPRKHSLSMMINAAKWATTKWCQANNYHFAWQDKFYDHVIRNEQEYWAIKNYIINNPRNWQQDRFYL
jgi:REP element-mobilizing transposase RayT